MRRLIAAALLITAFIVVLRSRASGAADGRTPIVVWGLTYLGEDIYTLAARFELAHPQYKVIVSSGAERDISGDGQRLISAVAGGVPPDVVLFGRHAIGEWASRGALADLTPLVSAQSPSDPYRLALDEYYGWALDECRYRRPGTSEAEHLYGIPVSQDIRILFANAAALRRAGYVNANGEPVLPRTWEELREYANRLTVYQKPGDQRSGFAQLGFAPNFGNSWLYLYGWQAGGELLSLDRTRVTMTSPPIVRALRYMTDVYDDLGGFARVDAFQRTFQQFGSMDPFIRGQVALKVDNDVALRWMAYYKPDMDFVIAPAPMPADRLAAGAKPMTWAGGFALVIPATAHNKGGAFEFIRYMQSWEARQLLEEGKRQLATSQGQLYLPEGVANRAQYERLIREHIFNNPTMPPRFKQAYQVLWNLLPGTLHRPVTPVGQLLWNQHVRAYEAAVNHRFAAEARAAGADEIEYTLGVYQQAVQRELDVALRPPPPHVVSWWPWIIGYAIVALSPLALMALAHRLRGREHGYRARETWAALLFLSPWALGMLVFIGGPILFSLIISFTRYDVLSPARWVGLDNYAELLRDEVFWTSLKNTLYMLVRVPLLMVAGLAIALLLNRPGRATGLFRTLYYLPAVVPLVASSFLWVWLLQPTSGPLSVGLQWLIDALHLPLTVPLWLQDPAWSKPSMILMSLWTAGAGMIIWLAGLQSIPPHLYEAASIDGANALQRFRSVTLPMLSPFILFNLIIGVIATMQLFAESFIMTNGGPVDSTLFYGFYLFKQAFQHFRMGYASALAWMLFVVVLALTLAQLWLSRRWVSYDRV